MLCEEQEIREGAIREYKSLKQKIVNELSEETDMKSMTSSRTGRFLRVGLSPLESPHLKLLATELTDKRI